MAQPQLDWVIAELPKLPGVRHADDHGNPGSILERVRGALERANNKVKAREWRAKTGQ